MASETEKRRFQYKLKSFDQLFGEIERLEKREEILAKYLTRVMKLAKACRVSAGSVGYDPDLATHLEEVLQVMFDELSQVPGKSRGYYMIEQMGVDFYEELRKQIIEEDKEDE